MSEKAKPPRIRKPKPLSLESIELDEEPSTKWGAVVKVSARELARFRAAYETLFVEKWNLELYKRRAEKARRLRHDQSSKRSDNLLRMQGRKRGREKNDEPFVEKQIFDEQSIPIQEALRALYNVASSVHLRKRCLEIIPVLKFIGDGKLWTLITAEIMADAKFSPTTIL